MTYLITGATGEIGSRVTVRLLRRGERPRVFARNVEKAKTRFGDRVEIAAGDLADAKSLRAALEGMDELFLVNSGPQIAHLDEIAAQAAVSAGVRHIVKLSSLDAAQGVGTGIWHARGEAAIRACSIAFTFLRPTGFMANAQWWAQPVKAGHPVRSATGDGRIPFIHSGDIAAVAIEALTTRAWDGETLPLTGPEALSYAEMVEKLSAAIGRRIEFEGISEEEERRLMLAHGETEEMVAAHLSIYRAIREGKMADLADGVDRVLGRKPIGFDEWLRENAEIFRT